MTRSYPCLTLAVPAAVWLGTGFVESSTTSVTVEAGGDLVENDPISQTDVHTNLFDKLPLESQSSSLSSLVNLPTAGIAAHSNGLFHAPGDHAENSFSLDGQPITDQQSGHKYKVSLQLTAINITNNDALLNFLSTLSGTHSVTPRALSAELGFHF